LRARLAGRFWAAFEGTGGIELAGLRAGADDVAVGGLEGGYLGARIVVAYAP
jgi:hypothetical protein